VAASRRRQKKAPSGAAPEGAKSDSQSGPSRCAHERNNDDDNEGEAREGSVHRAGGFHEWAAKKGELRRLSRREIAGVPPVQGGFILVCVDA